MNLRFELDLGTVWNGVKGIASRFHIEHFLLLYFAVHMLQIAFPSDGSMIFDEAHYVPASVATLNGIAANAEHPPLPKIIGAIGIALFGNNWFGWRFPEVIMQILALYMIYLIGKRLMGNPWALGATMLLGLDTVFFIHGGALLIDMAMFLFGYLAIELYFRKHYFWSAASMGLAFTAREMSIFLFAALGIYHLYVNRRSLKPALKIALSYTLIALIVFGGVMFAYDLGYQPPQSISVNANVNANVVLNQTGHPITTIYSTSYSTSKVVIWNPIQHVVFIYQYHGPGGIVIREPYAPYQFAWDWILPFDPVPYNGTYQPPDPLSSPTYFRVDVAVTTGGVTTHYTPIWYRAQANLALWYGFWPALVGLGYVLLKSRRKPEKSEEQSTCPHCGRETRPGEKYCDHCGKPVGSTTESKPKMVIAQPIDPASNTKATALFFLSGIVLNYIPWLTLSILVRRIGFNYYMIYTLPFLALGLAFTWKLLPREYGKLALALNILIALAFFIYFFPVHPMP